MNMASMNRAETKRSNSWFELKHEDVVNAVEKGDENAKTMLAWLLLSGLGGAEVDAKKAVELLEQRVADGDAEAMWMLGLCKQYGTGTEKDIERAKSLYLNSSKLKSATGTFVAKGGNGRAVSVDARVTKGGTVYIIIGRKSFFERHEKLMPIAPWFSFQLNNETIGPEAGKILGETLKANTTLKRLVLDANRLSDESANNLGESLACNTTLTVLSLVKCEINENEAMKITEGLKKNTTLIYLSLKGNSFGDRGTAKLSEALRTNNSLTLLDLESNWIGNEGATKMGEALMTNSALTTLDMSNNRIGEGATRICEALKTNSTLTLLNLGGNSMTAEPAVKMGETLKVNKSLTTLSLSKNRIRDEGAKGIGESLIKNDTLTELHLADNDISCAGISKVTEALLTNSSLTSLNLSGNYLGFDGAFALTEALKVNTTLTTLYLRNANLGNAGLEKVFDSLRVNTSLSELYLDSNKVEELKTFSLARAIAYNSTLTTLGLGGNNFERSEWDTIKVSLMANTTLTSLNVDETKLAWLILSEREKKEKEQKHAVEILRKQVMKGDPNAMWMLGLCFQFGIGTEKNRKLSFSLYKASHSLGNEAAKQLIRSFLSKEFVELGCKSIKGIVEMLAIVPWINVILRVEYLNCEDAEDLGCALAINSSIKYMELHAKCSDEYDANEMTMALRSHATMGCDLRICWYEFTHNRKRWGEDYDEEEKFYYSDDDEDDDDYYFDDNDDDDQEEGWCE